MKRCFILLLDRSSPILVEEISTIISIKKIFDLYILLKDKKYKININNKFKNYISFLI
jgi:hypothetical protein